MPRLRFSREEAEAEARRLATEFVSCLPGVERLQCRSAMPDGLEPKSSASKHPVAWIVVFAPCQSHEVVMDGGELFVKVNIETKAVSSA